VNRVRLDWIGLTLILWSVLTRAAVNAESLPGWDADPSQMSITIVGIGPTGSLVFDIAIWLGAGLVFFSKRCRKSGIDLLSICSIAGAACVLARTLIVDAHDTEAIRIGSSWAAGWVGFAAVLSQAHRPLIRNVLGSLLAGFVLFLCSKAFVQVFVEHPNMLAQFDADPVANLVAQGIEPDSAQARSYERRLRQPDPTGWFGLSNVLASVLAAWAVFFAYSAVQSRGLMRWAGALAGLVSGAALVTTGSKAGIAVTLLGLGLIVATRFLEKSVARIVSLIAIATPVAAVVVRGIADIPSSDLSLLVRWFYMRGAFNITGSELPLGAGPTGFQDLYLSAKLPESTEDVISPHMIWLDYSATLGVVAIPLVLSLGWIVWRLCSHISTAEHNETSQSEDRLRTLRPYFVLVLIVPVLIGAWLEVEATPLESAVSRLVGVTAWAVVSFSLLWAGLPTSRGLAFAGVVLLCHAQLDMNMTLPGSVPLIFVCFALAVSTNDRRVFQFPVISIGVLAVAALVVLSMTTISVWAWEARLRQSSERLSALVEERNEMMAQNRPSQEFAMLQGRFDEAGLLSLDELSEAFEMMPSDSRVAQAAARLAMALSGSAASVHDRERALVGIERAELILTQSLQTRERASTHAQLAHVRLEKIRILGQGPVRELVLEELRTAVSEGFARASELAPYSSRYPTSLALALSEMGNTADASRWAAEALRRDAFSTLDPLMSLPDSTRRRLARIARNP
jgi:hypothetical protein